MTEHVIEVVVEAWHEYEMRLNPDAENNVSYSEGTWEMQSSPAYETWECSCGESFEGSIEAEKHLNKMLGESNE